MLDYTCIQCDKHLKNIRIDSTHANRHKHFHSARGQNSYSLTAKSSAVHKSDMIVQWYT